ncbi:unnamed protein product [Dracunculus medinensis]|uniref:Cyclin_C domain-containing protein n=1 Tax=Dracunculus medinensis TaxID=318479 RepID=A0A0N4UJ48_DRAME|nr:unnamed protein product [Dracunculus medinensis]
MMDLEKRRKVFTFVIESGIRLQARNQTICSACILTHRALSHEDSDAFCPYEDEIVGIRDVINIAYSVIYPDRPLLDVGPTLWNLRESLVQMEYITLRFLDFRMTTRNPHNFLLHYISALQHWCPREFEQKHVGELSFILLRDAHVHPDWVLAHSPQTVAIICLSIALRASKVNFLNFLFIYISIHHIIINQSQ